MGQSPLAFFPNLPQDTQMQIFHSWRDLPAQARRASVALGNFDGVHLGHAMLVRAAHAARPDLPLAVLTFTPHPREVFRPEDPPFHLTTPAGRANALKSLGVRIIYELPFDHDFAHFPPETFVHDILHQGIGAAHLVCGPDFAFGHRRGGDTSFLAARAEALGMGLTLVPPLADQTGPYSSSRVRRALQDGYPERAASILGRPFAITGIVTHGDARGRTIGVPTANVALGPFIEPARGVYAARVSLEDGRVFNGVANIGRRPTVAEGLLSRIETHLFDFEGDLYGQEIAVSLIAYLREEQKFPGFEALKTQITRDALEARNLLAAHNE